MKKLEPTLCIIRPDRDRMEMDPFLVGAVINDIRHDIDHRATKPSPPDTVFCEACGQLMTSHDGATAFYIELQPTRVRGGGCCTECSQQSDEELLK
jgi:hypothetical protein